MWTVGVDTGVSMTDLAQHVYRIERRLIELETRMAQEFPPKRRFQRASNSTTVPLDRAQKAIAAVCEVVGITPDDMIYGGRCQFITAALRLACYVLVIDEKLSLNQAAGALGGRHHTTIMHHRDCAHKLVAANDPEFCSGLAVVRKILKGEGEG